MHLDKVGRKKTSHSHIHPISSRLIRLISGSGYLTVHPVEVNKYYMPIPQNATITLKQQSLRARNKNYNDNNNDILKGEKKKSNTTGPFVSRQGPKKIRAQLSVTIQKLDGNFKNSSLAALSSSWQPTRNHHSETTRPAMRCSTYSINNTAPATSRCIHYNQTKGFLSLPLHPSSQIVDELPHRGPLLTP